MTRPGSLLAACCLLPLACAAREARIHESLNVFAERLPLRADGTQAVTVLGREAIEQRNAISLSELLREIVGLHVDRAGGTGGVANVYVRGGEPNHTVVLVDGVRVNDPTDVRGGSYDLGAINVEEIERIEVLRGASSAQFGADAIGGVINIVTRRPGTRRVRVGAGAGGGGYREAHASFAAAGAHLGVQGLEDGRDPHGHHQLRSVNGSWAGAWNDSARSGLSLRHGEREARGFPESSGGARLAANRQLERRDSRETVASLRHEQRLGSHASAHIAASRFERDEDRDSPEVLPGPGGFIPATRAETRLRRNALAARAAWDGLPLASTLTFGGEWQRESGRRDSVLVLDGDVPSNFALSRDSRAAFLQIDSAPTGAMRVLLGARADRIDPDLSRTSRSAGVRYEAAAGHALRAHWSEGFKPASFFSLADPIVGNPSLRPERSRSSELGYEVKWTHGTVQATLFDSRVADLVDFDPATFSMVNRHDARIRGGELSATVRTALATLEAAYTYADARLRPAGERLRNRPRHRASLALSHAWGPWTVRAAGTHVGETLDFSIPTGEARIGSHTVVDVTISWRQARWQLSASVDNALDRDYESFLGFTTPGARARVKGIYSF